MKHFVEARLGCLEALRSLEIAHLFQRACLIIDLQGRIRLVLRPTSAGANEEGRQRIKAKLQAAGEGFWTDELWIEQENMPPSERALYEEVWKEARSEPPGQDRTFVLDRRLSKDAWLSRPYEPPWPLEGEAPPILSFYSFKGGVGRTTALLAVAVNAARAGLRCLIVDFDLEAPGAGTLASPDNRAVAPWGVVDFVLEYPVVSKYGMNLAEYYHVCDDPKVIGDTGEPIHVVPAGALDDWYLEKLARVNYEVLYHSATPEASMPSPLHALLQDLCRQVDPHIVLVDSRAGLHDLGGLSLCGLAHQQVLMGLHSEQSWQGLRFAISRLGKQMLLEGKTQRDCTIVHAHAPPLEPGRLDQIRAFRERSFDLFRDLYYDPADSEEGEWPLPDPEDPAAPHYPAVLTWDQRIAGYRELREVANFLCEGEYRALTITLLERVGRSLE